MTERLRQPTDTLPCPNPFCDGYGDIDVSPGITGRSRAVGACKVGPHPSPHPLSSPHTGRPEGSVATHEEARRP